MDRLWKAYAAGGLAVVGAYLLLPTAIARDLAYAAVGASTVVALVVGMRVHRPRRAAAWVWLAAGQLLWVVGDAFFSWFNDVLGVSPFPSIADAFYLMAYVVIAVGLGMLIRARRRGPDPGGLIDAALVAVALGLVSWVTVAAPIAGDTEQTELARVIGIAYPAADIVLLAMLVRLLVGPGARSAAYRLLALGTGLVLAGDAGFAVLTMTSSYEAGALDLLWLLGYVSWGVAALHPSMGALPEQGTSAPPLTRRRLATLTVAVLIAPGLLISELIVGGPLDAWPVAVCSIALFGLVVARMHLAMLEVRDSVRSRDLARDHLAHQEEHDLLTQLANRAHTLEMVGAALGRGQRAGALVGVLQVDLDRFKPINDTHGHGVGDELLRTVAQRLRSHVRAGDTVGRVGGDEFVVVVEAPVTEDALVESAERLLHAISAPMVIAGRELTVTASIGVAVARDGGTDADQVLFEADAATNRAKMLGRARVEIFDEDLRREHLRRIELEGAIRRGLVAGEFVLYYQPIVDVVSRTVASYEALIRWERPGWGLVPPDEFIPVAEQSTLICALDRWVLRTATRQAAQWAAGPDGTTTIAVNVSGRHVAGPEMVTDVVDALAAAGLPAERLVVEITETLLLDQPAAIANLASLRELGVGISIDDFGTGYTSISQLQNLPVDSLKIDRSLVASPEPGAAALVALVVHAAHAFGLTVVGEGVELDEQLLALAGTGCDHAQGYYFARPLPADRLTHLPVAPCDADAC